MKVQKSSLMRVSTFLSIFALSFLPVADSFSANTRHLRRHHSPTALFLRKNVEIPLLDLSDSEYADSIVVPLPSAHLPEELGTLFLYGMELKRPVHKMIIKDAIQSSEERVYGHLVYRKEKDLVGAIGCTAKILINAQEADADTTRSDVGNDAIIVVLCKGMYRFIVKEVVKTFPFPIVIVDELVDEPPSESSKTDDDYDDLDTSELVRRIMVGLKTLIDQKLNDSEPELSPLEVSILEESGLPVTDASTKQSQAEEMAAVFDVFQSSLIDIAPLPVDRYYAIAMMAAEMVDMENETRRKILSMTNGVARLRDVLRLVESTVSMNQARKMASSITDGIEENKDLKVGEPQLPPWAKSITDGTRVEYFWSEADGWCGGVVDGDPVKILDELIVTVRFDDGETHRLPFNADEKLRWRPPQD